jgi:hypothetical protein
VLLFKKAPLSKQYREVDQERRAKIVRDKALIDEWEISPRVNPGRRGTSATGPRAR